MFGRLFSKISPYISRGIGVVNAVSRTIGQVAPHTRTIGQIVNSASGGRLASSQVGQKLAALHNQVVNGAEKAQDFIGHNSV